MTIIDKQARPCVYEIPDDEPPPKGIAVYRGDDTFLVSRAFIDFYAHFYKCEDAVRINDASTTKT